MTENKLVGEIARFGAMFATLPRRIIRNEYKLEVVYWLKFSTHAGSLDCVSNGHERHFLVPSRLTLVSLPFSIVHISNNAMAYP